MNYKLTSEEACAAVLDAMKMKINKTPEIVASVAFYSLYGDIGVSDLNDTRNHDAWYESSNALGALKYHSKQQLASKGVIEGEISSQVS